MVLPKIGYPHSLLQCRFTGVFFLTIAPWVIRGLWNFAAHWELNRNFHRPFSGCWRACEHTNVYRLTLKCIVWATLSCSSATIRPWARSLQKQIAWRRSYLLLSNRYVFYAILFSAIYCPPVFWDEKLSLPEGIGSIASAESCSLLLLSVSLSELSTPALQVGTNFSSCSSVSSSTSYSHDSDWFETAEILVGRLAITVATSHDKKKTVTQNW